MPTLQDEQPPFDRAVCDAMVASTPDTWSVIVLTLERRPGVTAVGQLEHSLTSPEGHPPVMPHDSLYEATYRLDDLFRRHGGKFDRAVYRVELLADSWRYTADFEYAEPPAKPKCRAEPDAAPGRGATTVSRGSRSPRRRGR
jgi:hypothetical protein